MKVFKEIITFTRKNGEFKAVITGVTGDITELESQVNLFLNPKECKNLDNYVFEKRRLTYLLGRYAAKEAICGVLQIENRKNVEIKKGIFEQPIVLHDKREKVDVSIAHTDDCAVAISSFTDHPVGIDLETIDSKNTDTVIEQLTHAENTMFSSIFSNEQKNIGAVVFWTVKEAMAKCIKTGLMTPLSIFELDEIQEIDKGYRSTFTNFGQYKAHSYLVENAILTIVMPKNSKIDFESKIPFVFNQQVPDVNAAPF